MSLPAWLEPLPDAEQMRATDRWAIEERGIPGAALMERAGAGLARLIAARAPSGRIAIACGKGNNGGDGIVAARLLREAGRDVDVLAVWPVGDFGPDAAEQAARLPGAAPEPFAPERLEGASVIVDALLGTGFSGAPRDPADGRDRGDQRGRRRPSSPPTSPAASTRPPARSRARRSSAVATATFHLAKPGLWIHPGKAHAGDVEVVDIGTPDGAPVEPRIGLIGAGVLEAVPHRGADSTKFSSGNVFVLGGSRGLTGAPAMSATGRPCAPAPAT